MARLNQIVSMLHEQRRDLLDQLSAIDRAIAALDGGESSTGGAAGRVAVTASPVAPEVPAELAESAVLPQRVTPRRMLSDAHKQALVVGKRKAREAKEAASGQAREMPADSFVPAIGRRGERQPPRLVKRPIAK